MRRALVPEIRPLDQYDSARARRAASLAWALATAHGGAGKVPPELQEPVYTDQYAQEHVKPPVTRLLLSAELLCRAWRQALPGAEGGGPPRDHAALLALLAQRGLAPALHGRPVTTADLHHAPLNMGAHLAVIDSLMVAFATEATSSLPTPLGMDTGPDAWEQKLLCWVDMVTRKLQESTERESSQRPAPSTEGLAQPSAPSHKHAIAFCLKESGSKPPVIRYRKDKVLPTQAPCFPAITGLQDLASGAALAAMLHYYCPQLIRLEDVCLKEPMSVADSLYNLQLLQDFCARRLGGGCPLALEDLLYMPPALRVNIGAFLAELFLCFEVLKPDFVRPRDLGDLRDSPGLSDALTPNSSGSNSSPVFSFRHPFFPGAAALSPLRGSPGPLHHSTSMSHVEGGFSKAWSRKQLSHPLSQAVSFSIPFGLDSDVDIVMGNPVGLLRSASSDSLAPPRRAHSPAPASTPVTRAIHKLPLTPKVAAVAGGAAEPPLENGLAEALGELPTIEEALQIIHSAERLVPDGAPAGFYLHSPEPSKVPEPLPMASPRTRHGPPNGDDASSPSSGSSGGSGVRMTSFAERKKKLAAGTGPEAGPERAAEPGPAGSAALSSEMSELGARLEEKRRAIEAQKKRIEAIFAKHRQRLGKSAFLQLRRHETGDPMAQPPAPPPQERDEEQGAPPGLPRPRQVSFCPEPGGTKTEEELGDYNRAVAKLNTALTSLQLDMQRLSAQQERLLQDKRPSQAWVIPAPKGNRPPPTSAASSPPRRPPSAVVTTAPRSPQPVPRNRTAPAATPKSPKRARPVELKLPPLTRVLTPPQNVDTLPHLRKFSPSQVPVQTRSSIHFSEDEGEAEVPEPPAQPQPESPDPGPRGGLRGAGGPRACGDGTSDASSPGEPRSSLVEVPLGSLHTGSDSDEDNGADSLEGSVAEGLEPEPRPSLGFYFKAEAEAAVEAEMAQKRASLLERQQRRSEEARQRRQWLEAEREQRREEAPRLEVEEQSRAPAPVLEPEEESAAGLASGGAVGAGGRRGAFTRQEHQRRQQLKLMEDLDKVLRPKAPGARPHRRGRPRTVCDDSALARSPPKGLLGARLSKVYSQSTLSLSTVANDPSNALSVKHPSRAASPVSPSRLLSTQSRERDWENASTASSPASVPEYTGPKLYKEPSAKSNKHIIHNALAHCCLAGRVNEPQKNRVLEEIEKSTATHFLILFRDGGCQFRALYAAGTEGEGLTRLAGCGPRAVAPAMIEGVYKYSSDRKRFTPIPSRSLSMSVDAFTIQGHFWQGRKPPTPKKPGTPK